MSSIESGLYGQKNKQAVEDLKLSCKSFHSLFMFCELIILLSRIDIFVTLTFYLVHVIDKLCRCKLWSCPVFYLLITTQRTGRQLQGWKWCHLFPSSSKCKLQNGLILILHYHLVVPAPGIIRVTVHGAFTPKYLFWLCKFRPDSCNETAKQIVITK